MTKLDEVVSDILISEGFESFCNLDPLITDRFDGFIVCNIWSSFIGMLGD